MSWPKWDVHDAITPPARSERLPPVDGRARDLTRAGSSEFHRPSKRNISVCASAALLRVDWNGAEAHTLMLRLDGRWTADDPARVRSPALPAAGGTRPDAARAVTASAASGVR